MKIKRKLFARRDYNGLDEAATNYLKKSRSKLAKDLLDARRNINNNYQKRLTEGWEKRQQENLEDGITESFEQYKKSADKRLKNSYTFELEDIKKRAKKARKYAIEDSLYDKKIVNKLNKSKFSNKAGIGLGLALTAGALYGGKKLYDRNKKQSSPKSSS